MKKNLQPPSEPRSATSPATHLTCRACPQQFYGARQLMLECEQALFSLRQPHLCGRQIRTHRRLAIEHQLRDKRTGNRAGRPRVISTPFGYRRRRRCSAG